MAELEVQDGRLYYPSENENEPDNRKVCHPETNSEQVLMVNSGMELDDAVMGGLIVPSKQPTFPWLWGKITKAEGNTGAMDDCDIVGSLTDSDVNKIISDVYDNDPSNDAESNGAIDTMIKDIYG